MAEKILMRNVNTGAEAEIIIEGQASLDHYEKRGFVPVEEGAVIETIPDAELNGSDEDWDDIE